MGRRKRNPEEQERREKIRELFSSGLPCAGSMFPRRPLRRCGLRGPLSGGSPPDYKYVFSCV